MTWAYLGGAVILLILNGFFVGAEFALTAARRTKIESLAESGGLSARTAQGLLGQLSFMLAGAQLGITMASLGLGAVAEPAVARLIESAVEGVADLPSGVVHSIAFVIALTIVVFFHMVVGEMVPKNIAIAEPEKTALRLAVPFRLYAITIGPLIRLLNAIANGGLRLFGVEPQNELISTHSAEELKSMIDESAKEGMLGGFEHRLLSSVLDIRDLDAAAAMIPRTEMVALPLTASATDLEQVVVSTGHSRIPAYAEDLDHVLGFFHAKDLLRIKQQDRDKPIARAYVRPMLVVPESLKLHRMLAEMRRERRHFALVVDEHGGTAGVLTIEDLIEELVGEIRDEYDFGEAEIERLGDDRFLVPGTLRIDEVADRLDIEIPEGEYDTVAGFLMDRLGRIPTRRDAIEHNGWRFRVRAMHRRRVVQVLIEREGS